MREDEVGRARRFRFIDRIGIVYGVLRGGYHIGRREPGRVGCAVSLDTDAPLGVLGGARYRENTHSGRERNRQPLFGGRAFG